jgi:hypothetical protein
MSLPTLIDARNRFTDCIYMGLPFFSAVPATRRIDTIFPLSGGGDLSVDRSISITMTPSGTLAVGSDRVIAGTSPILINGGPSDILQNDITISMNPFNGLQDGYVVQNPNGVEGKFYQDDGNWGSTTVSGVPSSRTLTMGVGLTIDGSSVADLSADRTIDGVVFNSLQKGFVPASGGDPTKALFADGTFKVPSGSGGGVTLQATTPGTADVGNAHITGVMIADTAMVAGSDKRGKNGVGTEPIYIKQTSPSNPAVIGAYFVGGTPSPGLIFRAARGTEAVPITTNNNDQLLRLAVESFIPVSGGVYGQAEVLTVQQDGTSNGSRVPFSTKLQAIGGASTPVLSYIWLNANGLGGVGTQSPVSGWEVATSFGLKPKAIISGGGGPTYTYTIDENVDPPLFMVDATTYGTTINLPTAAGRNGRVYGFTKVDETTFHLVTLVPSGSQTIGGGTSFSLYSKGSSVLLASDGVNWQILSNNVSSDQSVLAADGTAIANTTVETLLPGGSINSWNGGVSAGAVYKVRWAGTLSTTGSPTLRFKIKNSSDGIVADSGIVEMPDTVTGSAWMMSIVSYTRSIGFATGRVVEATLKVAASDGVMTEFSMMSTFGNPSGGPQPNYVTVQWGTSSASNSVTCTAMQSELTPHAAVI